MESRRQRRHTTAGSETANTVFTIRAFAFFCLFDGPKIPSIRRLTRKPRMLCFEPLINYNTSLFRPMIRSSINGQYRRLMNLDCTSKIDPKSNDVISLIKKTFPRSIHERIVVHYFSTDTLKVGKLIFFDENYNKELVNFQNVIGVGTKAPVVLIVEANSSGSLIPELNKLKTQEGGLIAFLSCDDNESMPTSPSIPFDILTSSILFPADSAVWFHSFRSLAGSNIQDEDIERIKTNSSFADFLNSVIDSVIFSKFDQATASKYLLEDNALATITRGFILAQRILSFYNIHPQAVPNLPNCSDSEKWSLLDLALDVFFSQGIDDHPSLPEVFQQLCISFHNFPSFDALPIFMYFFMLEKHTYTSEVEHILLEYIDEHVLKIPSPLAIMIIRTIISYYACPSAPGFCALAKLAYFNKLTNDDIKHLIFKTEVLFADGAAAGLLACSACILNMNELQGAQLFDVLKKLMAKCVRMTKTEEFFSAISYGFILSKISRRVTEFTNDFLPLLENKNESTRSATAFALGCSKDVAAIPSLTKALYNESYPDVAREIICALQKITASNLTGISPEDQKEIKESIIQSRKTLKEINNLFENVNLGDEIVFSQNDAQEKASFTPRGPSRKIIISKMPEFFKTFITENGLWEKFTKYKEC